MTQGLTIGDEVVDSPVGPGLVESFYDGYPVINGQAVSWAKRTDNEIYSKNSHIPATIDMYNPDNVNKMPAPKAAEEKQAPRVEVLHPWGGAEPAVATEKDVAEAKKAPAKTEAKPEEPAKPAGNEVTPMTVADMGLEPADAKTTPKKVAETKPAAKK